MSYEPGAPVAEGFIPLCAPVAQGNEWEYIKQCLDTGWVSSVGPFVDRFEHEMAEYLGVRYAVAVVNGTAALHVALIVSGVQPDDEVLVSALSFISPANAIRYAGAWPVFIDAEPEYWQMDPARVTDFLENRCQQIDGTLHDKITWRRVSAIVPVHILGHPADMDPILELAAKFNLAVIEDATESLGARYKGRPVGQLGNIACLSFNGNKLITTGGGGMIVTDDETLARRARYLSTQAKDDPLEYVHHEIGFNYRLTNIQAAMGCAQLENITQLIQAKLRIAERYTEALAHVPGITSMGEAPWAESVFWLFTVLVNPSLFGSDSRELLKSLMAQKIQARPLWQPLHVSRAHQDAPRMPCPTALKLNQMGLSLPCSVNLTPDEQNRVIEAVAALAGSGA